MPNSMIPLDHTCPVIYDNDAHSDTYTDEYLIALASAGEINLRGLITSSPANPYVSHDTFLLDVAGRAELVAKARRCGMRNVPDPVAGCDQRLARPVSDLIEDTQPRDTPGTRLILEEAHKASPEKPLVVVMGGTLTAAVSAYLLDPSIADRMVVSILAGNLADMDEYNAWTDPWAAYILLERMRALIFPGKPNHDPRVPVSRLVELPECEYRQWMIEKRLPHVKLPGERDGDGQPAVALMLPNYVLAEKGISCGGWKQASLDERQVPVYRDNPHSRARQVLAIDHQAGTREWWRALTNPQAWGNNVYEPVPTQRSFYACPFPIGLIHRFEAEDFDHGGEGQGYHLVEARGESSFRPEAVPIVAAGDVPGGYNLGAQGGFSIDGLRASEWLAYSLDLPQAAGFSCAIRVGTESGGVFHLEVDQIPVTGPLSVPVTNSSSPWATLRCQAVLPVGRHILRLAMDSGSAHFNYFELTPRS